MTVSNRILITVSMLLLSLPALADDNTSNILTTFFNDHEDILKNIIPLIATIVTVGGAIFVTKIARKAPDAAVKLEQLKFIEGLIFDKAWSKPEFHFVVEEAFRLYFKTYIPIEIIKLLAVAEERFFAFSSYAKVKGLISYNKQTDMIKSLSEQGKNIHMGALLSLMVLCVHFFIIFLALAISSFSEFSFYYITLSGSFAIISTFSGWVVCISFKKMIDLKSDFRHFESKVEGKFEPTEVNKSDWAIIIFCILFVIALWVAWFCLSHWA